MAAVSARRMVSPNEADISPHSEVAKLCSSSAVQPPSGPTASASRFQVALRLQDVRKRCLTFGFVEHDAKREKESRRLWLDLEIDLLRRAQRWRFQSLAEFKRVGDARRARCGATAPRLRGRSAASAPRAFPRQSQGVFPVRRATTGMMWVTFSSVHFSMAHSMRSNLNTASRSVIGITEPAAISSPSANSTRSPATRATVARRTRYLRRPLRTAALHGRARFAPDERHALR